MAQEKPNRLSEWLLTARTQAPIVRQHLRDWVGACREEPRLIWETAAVRYSTYGIGGLVIVQIVLSVVGMIAPPPPASAKPAAVSADYHVVCTQPECGEHFIVHRRFGFSGFPVECPVCKQPRGMPARRCHSEPCRGRWVAPVKTPDGWRCPQCSGPMEPVR